MVAVDFWFTYEDSAPKLGRCSSRSGHRFSQPASLCGKGALSFPDRLTVLCSSFVSNIDFFHDYWLVLDSSAHVNQGFPPHSFHDERKKREMRDERRLFFSLFVSVIYIRSCLGNGFPSKSWSARCCTERHGWG
jgi:hypothetical protein